MLLHILLEVSKLKVFLTSLMTTILDSRMSLKVFKEGKVWKVLYYKKKKSGSTT